MMSSDMIIDVCAHNALDVITLVHSNSIIRVWSHRSFNKYILPYIQNKVMFTS